MDANFCKPTPWFCAKTPTHAPVEWRFAGGFTTAGMVGVIATSHIIKTLGLNPVGTVMHKDFPAVALIHNEVPKHPVRVSQGDGIGVFTSEIQFGNETDIMFASTVLEWFTKGGFDRLIVIDGLTSRPEKELSNGELFGVGSTPEARERLKGLDIEPIQQGIVAGITGFLLGEGGRLGIDVTALLSGSQPHVSRCKSCGACGGERLVI